MKQRDSIWRIEFSEGAKMSIESSLHEFTTAAVAHRKGEGATDSSRRAVNLGGALSDYQAAASNVFNGKKSTEPQHSAANVGGVLSDYEGSMARVGGRSGDMEKKERRASQVGGVLCDYMAVAGKPALKNAKAREGLTPTGGALSDYDASATVTYKKDVKNYMESEEEPPKQARSAIFAAILLFLSAMIFLGSVFAMSREKAETHSFQKMNNSRYIHEARPSLIGHSEAPFRLVL